VSRRRRGSARVCEVKLSSAKSSQHPKRKTITRNIGAFKNKLALKVLVFKEDFVELLMMRRGLRLGDLFTLISLIILLFCWLSGWKYNQKLSYVPFAGTKPEEKHEISPSAGGCVRRWRRPSREHWLTDLSSCRLLFSSTSRIRFCQSCGYSTATVDCDEATGSSAADLDPVNSISVSISAII
jgi:hypothetical protein